MAEQPEPKNAADGTRRDGFVKELSRSAAKKALAPLAATAATAGTAYITGKTRQIWQESVLPRIQDKGGGKAFAKDALERAAHKLGGPGSGMLLGLANRLDEGQPAGKVGAQEPERTASATTEAQNPDPRREQGRRERQRRRQQRQRALEQSGST